VRADPFVLRMERRVAAFVAGRDVVRRGERVLLMLSGGADSMAMLALVRAADERLGLGLGLAALHVDYGLRGADSARDREIVVRACAAAGIDLEVVALEGRLRGPDFQARARELRYERAWQEAARRACTVVTAAHNRDDQAETIVYRLAKYASPQGLVGMRPREQGAPGRAALARPLLCLGADEIRAYCATRGIEFGEDVTNAAPIYARNIVRHEVLPRLARLNPRVTETLAAAAGIAAAEREVVAAAVEAAWERVAVSDGEDDLAALDLDALAREPEALRALCLRRLLERGRAADALVERREVEALERLAARRDDAGSVSIRGGWEVVRGGGRLRLRRRRTPHVCSPMILPVGGRACFCGRRFVARLLPGAVWPDAGVVGRASAAPPVSATGRAVVPTPVTGSASKLPSGRSAATRLEAFVGLATPPLRLELRHPARGDRFTPFAMEGETTVARFLAAAHVPPAARERALVLVIDGCIAWVGYETRTGERRGRVAQPFRVSESTACTLHVVEEEG